MTGVGQGGIGDDDVVPFRDSLQWQVRVCDKAGAPIAARILEALGCLANELPVPQQVRFGDFIPLRLLAGLHALALLRRAPALAMVLPTTGGGATSTLENITAAVQTACESEWDFLAAYMSSPPQTNEVGRARPLRTALNFLGVQRQVHLRELGSSGGLLLNADRLGPMPGEPAAPLPAIISRIGYDTAPVDILSPDGRTRLSSYIWPDHLERFQRLGAAITVAQQWPPDVRRMDAVRAVESLELAPGADTLIWHSALIPYLTDSERHSLESALDSLGRTSTADTRVAVASWEVPAHGQARRLDFQLRLTLWSGSGPQQHLLAHGNSHATEVVAE